MNEACQHTKKYKGTITNNVSAGTLVGAAISLTGIDKGSCEQSKTNSFDHNFISCSNEELLQELTEITPVEESMEISILIQDPETNVAYYINSGKLIKYKCNLPESWGRYTSGSSSS